MGVQVPKRGTKMTGHALQIQGPLLLVGQRVNHVGLGRAGHAPEHHVGRAVWNVSRSTARQAL